MEQKVQVIAERAVESVLGAIERGLGASASTSPEDAAGASSTGEGAVEDIAAHADELAKRIELKIKHAGRKHRDARSRRDGS